MAKKDIELEYIHLCDYASPGMGGKINLIGIFGAFFASFPAKLPDFFMASRIVNLPKNIECTISFKITQEEKIIYNDSNPIKITIQENSPGQDINLLRLMKGINLKNSGNCKFIILVNDSVVGEKQVEVKPLEVK